VDVGLASMVVKARHAAGLSQAEVARRAGISASYLSRIEAAAWERGGPWPTDGVLRALARVLGLSSTALVAERQAAWARQGSAKPAGHRPRAHGRMPYAVSVGPEEVDAAARDLVERNPRRGTLRSAQVFMLEAAPPDHDHDRCRPSYVDTLGAALAARPDTILYRVAAADRRHVRLVRSTAERLAGGRPPGQVRNVRSRFTFCNPLVLDVLIGDHGVLVAFPDRGGHPDLRAGVVVDDPDFVAAVREWFDDSVWDAPCEHVDIRGEPSDEALAAIEARLPG
jgi:transcriptional regulator with XRE-family HTH domain